MSLFFAIWPDESTRRLLDGVAKKLHVACGGKKTSAESIHLTLAFLGEMEGARVAQLGMLASGIPADAFEIRLDRVARWKHNRIAWAGASAVPKELVDLAAHLRTALEEGGFDFDRRSFVPHVTLVRKAGLPKALPEFEPVCWSVSEFCLAGSSDSGYAILGRWPLKINAALQVPG